MEKQGITITVSGKAKSGKSHLIYYLKKFLRENGFDVLLSNDIDYPNEERFDNQMNENFEKIMDSIKDSKTIVLSETRQGRTPEAEYETIDQLQLKINELEAKCKSEYQRGIEDGNMIL